MGLASGSGPRLLVLAFACVCALLCCAQAASADTYCVYKTADQCPADVTHSFDNVAAAVGAANARIGDDVVAISAGEFDIPALTATDLASGLTINGAGAATHLTFTGAGTAIDFGNCGAVPGQVTDLSLALPSGTTGIAAGCGLTVDRVAIGNANSADSGIKAIAPQTFTTISRTQIALGATASSTGVFAQGATNAVISVTDSAITANGPAIDARGPGVSVERSTLTGTGGVSVQSQNMTVANSVAVITAAGGSGPFALDTFGNNTIGLTNVTAVDRTGSGADSAVVVNQHLIGSPTVSVSASLFSGFDAISAAAVGGGAFTTNVDHSERYSGTAPDLVDVPGGNYHLRADSALIDQAPAAAAGATDLDGNPRSVDVLGAAGDHTRDVGAYEFQPHDPTVGVTASAGSIAVGEDVTFTAAAADPDPGDSLIYVWSVDGGPSATGGPTLTRSFSSAGTHSVSVTVLDRSRRSAGASATVTVAAPPDNKPPPKTDGPKPGVCINEFNGTTHADVLNGSKFGDAMIGGTGNDTLNGRGGDDCLLGDEGNDTLNGGSGGDSLRGFAGNDRLNGGTGDDSLMGAAGNDVLDGGPGKDLLDGGKGNDRLKGGASNDNLTGGPGTDSFSAGAGNDKLNSADGKRERVDCGPGRDRVTADAVDRLLFCEKVKRLRPQLR